MDCNNDTVLFACHEMFRRFLNTDEIIPFLGQYDMLTANEREILLSHNRTRIQNVDFILNILPSKGRNWFDHFVSALKLSAKGTGSAHLELARALKKEKAKYVPAATPTTEDIQPSRIANETYKFASLNYLQPASAGNAFPASPSMLRQHLTHQKVVQDLQTLQKTQSVVTNQIKLLSQCELLINQTETFRDALASVQRFYVDKYRNNKLKNLSILTEKQLTVIKIIESITGCDEKFDMVREIEEWTALLKMMKGNYDTIKQTLFTLDDTQIHKMQLQLKPTMEAKAIASQWIEDREVVVTNGIASFNELKKLADSGEVAVDFISDVQRRIEAGKRCLAVWKDWMKLLDSL